MICWVSSSAATTSSLPTKLMKNCASTALYPRYVLMRFIHIYSFLQYYLWLYASSEPQVEILRMTWEKTSNPIIRFFTRKDRPAISVRRKFILPRPVGSKYTKPITCWLYFARPELDLVRCKHLILDVPGGGFIAMRSVLHFLYSVQLWL